MRSLVPGIQLIFMLLALLSSLACQPNADEATPHQADQSPSAKGSSSPEGLPLPTRIPTRVVPIKLVDHDFYAGDTYLFLAAYTKTGGSGATIAADWRDVVLDLSSLEEEQFVPVGQQNDTGGEVLAAVCRSTHPRLLITETGLVFPLGATRMEAGGPFLRLTLFNHDRKRVDPNTLKIQVSSSSDEQYNFSISQDQRIIISGVTTEVPLRLDLSDLSGKVFAAELFPYVRGAMHELVNYNVYKVAVGTVIPESK